MAQDVEFFGSIIDESKKCWFVLDGRNRLAIPKSQVTKLRWINEERGDASLTIPLWLAKEKGII